MAVHWASRSWPAPSLANQRWLDRHFLPSFFLPRLWYVRLEIVRARPMAALGPSLVFIAPPACRAIRRALGRNRFASRLRRFWRSAQASSCFGTCTSPPQSGWCRTRSRAAVRSAARLDLRTRADRTQHASAVARIDYAIDAAGYRVRRVDEPVDFDRPTILFTGESVMFGEGLTWDESGAGAGRRDDGDAERESRRPRLRHRSGVSEAPGRAAALSPAGGRGVAVHDGAVRPKSRRRSSASRARSRLAAGRSSAAGSRRSRECSCRTAVMRRRSRRRRHARGAPCDRRARTRARRDAAHRRAAARARGRRSKRRCGGGSSTTAACRTCWWRSTPPGVSRGTGIRTREPLARSPRRSPLGCGAVAMKESARP